MATKKQQKVTPKSPSDTYLDLLIMRLNLQQSIEAAPASLKSALELALVALNEEMEPLHDAYLQRTARTWHMVAKQDQHRIQCSNICGQSATICHHASPGFFYYCHDCAHVGEWDRVWQQLPIEEACGIQCQAPGCDEGAHYSEWVPRGDNRRDTNHFCNYHAFRQT